jgi:hypothetical protein
MLITKTHIASKGGIAPLIALVKEGTPDGMENAARALTSLAMNADRKKAVLDLGGLKVVEGEHAKNKESKNIACLLNALMK